MIDRVFSPINVRPYWYIHRDICRSRVAICVRIAFLAILAGAIVAINRGMLMIFNRRQGPRVWPDSPIRCQDRDSSSIVEQFDVFSIYIYIYIKRSTWTLLPVLSREKSNKFDYVPIYQTLCSACDIKIIVI